MEEIENERNEQQEQSRFQVVGQYVAQLNAAPLVKISSLDLNDPDQVLSYASQGNENKQLVAATDSAYRRLSLELNSAIKTQINTDAAGFNQNAGNYHVNNSKGDARFSMPTMYMIYRDEKSGSWKSEMITPSDLLRAYKFLMLRNLNGENAYKFDSNYVISFSPSGRSMYGKSDLFQSFEFKCNEISIRAYNGRKPNENAMAIMKGVVNEFKKIVMNVFKANSLDCNTLKNNFHNENIVKEVCKNTLGFGDPDFTFSMLECFETFQTIMYSGGCSSQVLDEPDF